MKIVKKITGMLLLLSCAVQAINEFRTPLSFRNDGSYHHWLGPIQNAVWHNETNVPCLREDCCFQANIFTGSFYRCASDVFFNVDKNKNTRKTTGLSSLFFGKDSFRGEEAFVDGIIKDSEILQRINPFLGFARITPTFDYTERGAFLGGRIDYTFGCENKWHAGGRASVPFKVIEIEQNPNVKIEETLEDVVRFREVRLDEVANGDSLEFAARFDFLNSIFVNTTDDADNPIVDPFIDYDNISGRIFIGSQSLTSENASDSGEVPAAYATKKSDGELPLPRFRRAASEVGSSLGVNGEAADGSTVFFKEDVDYSNNLRCNRDAQGTLFIVSRAEDDLTDITDAAGAVVKELRNIIQNNLEPAETALEFFRTRGIDMRAHERIAALGDIELETYVGYGHRDCWYLDGILGVRLPTGKKKDSDDSPFYISTGHNRHTEIKLGLEAGWMPWYWMGFKIDGSFHHAFKRTEQRALAFKDSTIRNIGNNVDVDVSWNYFIGHVDWTVFHPWNTEMGAVIGYEFFGKRKDNVDFKDMTTATDLLGRTNQELDSELLETRTNSMSHKIRGQIFHRWNLFEVFAGASHVFAGRSVMKETEAHLGFAIHF